MAISPFHARPATPGSERRRARLAVILALIGIAAILIVYAISPGVRHAVRHAAHSVKHAVGNVFDPDHGSDDHPHPKRTVARHPGAGHPGAGHPVAGRAPANRG